MNKLVTNGLGIVTASTALSVLIGSSTAANAAAVAVPKVTFPPLPYEYNSLAPFISEKTLFYHHDKHHAKYVETTLNLIKDTDNVNEDLVTIMKRSKGKNPVLFNNAAQVRITIV